MKTLHIFRGPSGSGKTTAARKLAQKLTPSYYFSTDTFWGPDYNIQLPRLGEAHTTTFTRFMALVLSGCKNPIILDNTNCKIWEFKHYVDLAIHFDYTVEYHEMMHPGVTFEQVHQWAERNTHDVPHEVVFRQAAFYEYL